MKSLPLILLLFVFAIINLPANAIMAGEVDNKTPPGDTNRHTLEDVWNRLDSGAPGSSAPPFEPSAFPSTGTSKTINEIMSIAPERDDANGAAPADVISGTEFWGLKEGAWGSNMGVLIPAPVPRTGQTSCWDASGTPVSCAGSGQDGDLRKGVSWPNPRFTDNGNGTVTDNLTGLIWLKDANCTDLVKGVDKNRSGLLYNPGELAWGEALTWCKNLEAGFCGLTDGSKAGDWRLPNVEELQSLVHYEFYGPAVPNTAGTGQWTEGNPFNAVQSSFYWEEGGIPVELPYYWSGSTSANDPSYAWFVDMCYGGVDMYVGGWSYYKAGPHYVWPVRGGQ